MPADMPDPRAPLEPRDYSRAHPRPPEMSAPSWPGWRWVAPPLLPRASPGRRSCPSSPTSTTHGGQIVVGMALCAIGMLCIVYGQWRRIAVDRAIRTGDFAEPSAVVTTVIMDSRRRRHRPPGGHRRHRLTAAILRRRVPPPHRARPRTGRRARSRPGHRAGRGSAEAALRIAGRLLRLRRPAGRVRAGPQHPQRARATRPALAAERGYRLRLVTFRMRRCYHRVWLMSTKGCAAGSRAGRAATCQTRTGGRRASARWIGRRGAAPSPLILVGGGLGRLLPVEAVENGGEALSRGEAGDLANPHAAPPGATTPPPGPVPRAQSA